jgi:hypothetical protein
MLRPTLQYRAGRLFRMSHLVVVVALCACFVDARRVLAFPPLQASPEYYFEYDAEGLMNGAGWSGATYHADDGDVYIIEEDGQLNVIADDLPTSNDTTVVVFQNFGTGELEGITWIEDDKFALVEETTGNIVEVDIVADAVGGVINRNILTGGQFLATNPNLGNSNNGLEGITYDHENDVYYVVKEDGTNRGIWLVDPNISPPQQNATLIDDLSELADLSGIQLVGDWLYVVSDDDMVVARFNLTTGELDTHALALPQAGYEGIAMPPDGYHIFVAGDGTTDELIQYEVQGDFNGNGSLDANDIDIIFAAIRNSSMNPIYDLNGDSDIDGDDSDYLIKDVMYTWYGDANLDGEFESGDLVDVLAAGEYEDEIEDNSGWAEGDWNGDADFDSSDHVVASADGGYEQGPRTD